MKPLRGMVLALLALCLAGPGPVGAQDRLTLDMIPSLVLRHDTGAAISAQTTLFSLHSYQGAVAKAFPQLDLSASYSLGYTASLDTQVSNPAPPPLLQNLTYTDYGVHSLDTKLTLSQLLPTAGSLLLTLENVTGVTTIGSQDLGGTTSSPDPAYTQAPRISLGITQPLFVNGKIIDFDLFPATLRKAQLGYLEQGAADTAQRNGTIGQAVQLYLSIVQLRKNVAQTTAAVEVTRGNLDSLQKNYELGLVAEADLLDAKIGLSRQEQGLLELSSTLAKTERLLAHSIGADGLAGVALAEAIPDIIFTLPREQAIDKALGSHPLLRQKALAAEEKRVDTVIAGQQFASTLNLSFSWTPRYPFDASNNPYTTTDFAGSFTDLFGSGSGNQYSFAAGLTIHLFDGGSSRETVAGSAALRAAAEQSLTAQRQSVQDQVELDYMQRASLEAKVALLQDAADLAGRRLVTEKNLLALGKSTDLAVAEKAADAEARADDLWRAKADLFLVLLDLHALSGDDLAAVIERNASAGAAAGGNLE
jgi:outer membrane protein TolC